MKKSSGIIIGVVAVIIIVVAIVLIVSFKGKQGKSKLEPVTSAEGLTALVDKVYEGKEDSLPELMTTIIDVKETEMVNMATGLEDGNDLEYLVISEPLIRAQAYSLVIAKVKDGVNANEVAKEMSEKIDPRKWICVEAEKIYATNSGDIVFLVMSSEENAKPVYESFKALAGVVGKEYEKTQAQ